MGVVIVIAVIWIWIMCAVAGAGDSEHPDPFVADTMRMEKAEKARREYERQQQEWDRRYREKWGDR